MTRSLREGFTNLDTFQDLTRRLESLPQDLEKLFIYMLNSVDTVYHSRMGEALQIALYAREPIVVEIYDFHNRELDDPDYAINQRIGGRPPIVLREIERCTRIRLDAITKGLLEVNNGHVQFLHRTVHDFLHTREMDDFLLRKSALRFHPAFSLLKAHVALIKVTEFFDGVVRMPFEETEGDLPRLLRKTLRYAAACFEGHHQLPHVFNLLDELDDGVARMFAVNQATFYGCSQQPTSVFREILLQSNMTEYLCRKVAAESHYFDCLEFPPLMAACWGNSLDASTLRVLLQLGQDPNRPLPEISDWPTTGQSTAWSEVSLRFSIWCEMCGSPPASPFDHHLARTFLMYGADPNANILKSSVFTFTSFASFLMTCFADALEETSFRSYLRTLDAFITSGADLTTGIEMQSSFYSRRTVPHSAAWWPPHGYSSTVLEAYCKGLGSRLWTDKPRVKLLCQTTTKIMAQVADEDIDSTQLETAIRVAFPMATSNSLLDSAKRLKAGLDGQKNCQMSMQKRKHAEVD